jgi:hypothetical protein
MGQILGFDKKGESPPVIKIEKFVGKIRKDPNQGKET